MRDLLFTYNTSNDVMNETKVEFLSQKDSKWNIRVNNEETNYSVTLYNDDSGETYYELEYNWVPIQTFTFDSTIYYVPSLFQIWEGCINHSKKLLK